METSLTSIEHIPTCQQRSTTETSHMTFLGALRLEIARREILVYPSLSPDSHKQNEEGDSRCWWRFGWMPVLPGSNTVLSAMLSLDRFCKASFLSVRGWVPACEMERIEIDKWISSRFGEPLGQFAFKSLHQIQRCSWMQQSKTKRLASLTM